MVTYVKGNIFESPAQVLTNPINCVGVMGKGLAKVFASKFPEMEIDYKERCNKGDVKIGSPYLWENDQYQVLNFPTKDHWKSSSKLEDIKRGLEALAANYDELGIGTVAIPALGCGLGGLNWSDVKPIIEEVLEPISDLHAFAYEPEDIGSTKMKNEGRSSNASESDDGFAAANP